MCTQISIKTLNNDIITGRTNEFSQYYLNNISFFPRQYELKNFTLGKSSTTIKSQYAIIGCNAGMLFGEIASSLEFLIDGFNEEGLSFATQYYPGMANYQEEPEPKMEHIDILAFPFLALGQYKTVKEVRAYIEENQGNFVVQPGALGADYPLHFLFIDRTGESIVVEPDKKGRVEIKESNGLMTNSPEYEWHLKNLCHYANIQQYDNDTSVLHKLDGSCAHSHGTCGGFGLPADTSPASRFIRANYLVNASSKCNVTTAEEGVLRLQRIFNNFDIIPGAALKCVPSDPNQVGKAQGEVSSKRFENTVETDFDHTVTGHTDHIIVKDLTNLHFYYKNWSNQSIRYVAMEDYDLNGSEVATIDMVNDGAIEAQRIIMK